MSAEVVRLNTKQMQFCKYYALTMNATSAALKAGYSQKTAYSQGSRLLKNAEIQKQIQVEIESLNRDLPDKSELKRFWYAVMCDENEKTSVRLAASTNLAKAAFMFNADLSGWNT